MKAKILMNLKNKYQNLGFSTEVLEGVASQLEPFVKEETEIEPAVNGAETMLKSFQRYTDSRVTSFKTEAETVKAEREALKLRLAEIDKKKPKEPEEVSKETQKLLDMFRAEISPLKESLSKFSEEKKHEELSKQFKSIIGDEIPESFYRTAIKGRTFKDETEIQEVVDGLKADYAEYSQHLADKGFEQTRKPDVGVPKDNGSQIASLINKSTEKIVEQKNK